MPYVPRIRVTKVHGRLQDPVDVLMEMFQPPPLPSEEEVELILARTPPEQFIIEMDKQPNGEYIAAGLIVPRYR